MAALPFTRVVIQPTSFCNIDCTYCYLADRHRPRTMSQRVARAVAESLDESDRQVGLIWHGGEPLSCGPNHFVELLAEFDALYDRGLLRHTVQTNATLIDPLWCEIFASRSMNVGVSIDGPAWATVNRIDRQGRPAFDRIMAGIEHLRTRELPFTCIAVIGANALARAKDIYDFFCGLGCWQVGINIEQRMGIHLPEAFDQDAVTHFWTELFQAWKANPVIEVREFTYALNGIKLIDSHAAEREHDLFPSVAHDGSVVLLSPEFLDASSSAYSDFKAGNVLDSNLVEICERAGALPYVRHFYEGVAACSRSCDYYRICLGGDAACKYFELGSTGATKTVACAQSEQALLEAVVSLI